MTYHNIPPVFAGDSKILILGSFPSPKSREQGFYYGHPQNRMWKVLSRVLRVKYPETAEERRQMLLENRIAMWDVLESCDIEGASDLSIRNERPNDLSIIFEKAEISAVFTTGGRASSCYRKYDRGYGAPHIALPSTSPANAACSEDRLAALYIPVLLYLSHDGKYLDFTSRLIPTVPKESMIGIRIPEIKRLSGALIKDEGLCREFLGGLPHRCHEENLLHAFLIMEIKDYDECRDALEAFLPYVDNWAVCDSLSPKTFAKNRDRLVADIDRWLCSDMVYTVRFALRMLMVHYLDGSFKEAYLYRAAKLCPTEQADDEKDYYLRMMVAWYLATALAKQWDSALPIIEKRLLSAWVHKKTIQKAVESRRLTDGQKSYLKSLG